MTNSGYTILSLISVNKQVETSSQPAALSTCQILTQPAEHLHREKFNSQHIQSDEVELADGMKQMKCPQL